MQDNWYNTNENWYEPNSFYEKKDESEIPSSKRESKEEKRKKRRGRTIALIACCALIAICVGCIFIFGQKDENGSFSSTDFLPKDWHNYLDNYYTVAEPEKSSEIGVAKAAPNADFSLSLSGSKGTALSSQAIFSKCAPSIVCITASDSENINYYSWGSGIIMSADGYIITNTHIIEGCDTVSVELYNGEQFDAKLVGADSLSDISVLKIDASGLVPAEFVSSSTVYVGDDVVAIGNPLGEAYRLTMTDGIISGISREVNHNGTVMNLLQTNAAINEGNSGGALINSAGQVIGITNMKMISSSGVEGIGFAIPSDTLKAIADALLKDGIVTGRATIGVTIGPVPEAAADYYKIPQGLYVSVVNEKSDAYAQGIRVGDIITHANGKEVHSNSDISAIKDTLAVGDSITFTVWRDDDTFEVFDATVKLMDANDLN